MANSRNSTSLNKPKVRRTEQAFERALEAILARVLLSAQDTIGIAYSGGLDSAVLLHLAAQFCAERDLRLHAFHVHHGLSPNADQWLDHAHQQCAALGIAFDSRRVSVENTAEHGIEQAARLARYAALGEMCEARGVRLLLTAHHEDDQAETVMLQWLRGAGLPGLSGMASLHQEHALLPSSVSLGRPLLELSRADLEQVAEAYQLAFVKDESNEDARYRRNALRHHVMPVIGEHFQGFAQTLSRSSRHLQSAHRLLTELARQDLSLCEEDGTLLLDRFVTLSPDRQDNLLRHWLQTRTGSYPSEAQLDTLCAQMLSAAPDAHPLMRLGGWLIERRYGRLCVTEYRQSHSAPEASLPIQWQGEAELAVPAWQGTLVFEESSGPGLDRKQLLRGPLVLKSRTGRERIKLSASRPSRTLKNLFQENAVAARDRQWLPLLYLQDQLVYVAGIGVDVRATVSDGGIVPRWKSTPQA